MPDDEPCDRFRCAPNDPVRIVHDENANEMSYRQGCVVCHGCGFSQC